MEKKKIELLAPAGDMERLKMAVAYGADAVYLAGNTFGMRSFAGNFSPEELKEAVRMLVAENNLTEHESIKVSKTGMTESPGPMWGPFSIV